MAATDSDLAGKVVLVTGGASSIGEAIVRRFAEQKSVVVFFDIKVEEGARLARELSARVLARTSRTSTSPISRRCATASSRRARRTVPSMSWSQRRSRRAACDGRGNAGLLGRPRRREPKAQLLCSAGRAGGHEGGQGMAAYTASKSGMLGLTRSLARLRPSRQCGRARLDHDPAPDREMADTGGRGRADAPPMPEAQAGPGRDCEVRGVPRLRRSLGLHITT